MLAAFLSNILTFPDYVFFPKKIKTKSFSVHMAGAQPAYGGVENDAVSSMNASGLVSAMTCFGFEPLVQSRPHILTRLRWFTYFSCGMNASGLVSAMKCFGFSSVSAVLELKH